MTRPENRYACLSYEMRREMPRPAGLPGVEIESIASMPSDISNVFVLRLCNHVGTHIDGPNHFDATKPPLSAWPIEAFIFRRVVVLDVPKDVGQLIDESDLRAAKHAIDTCDLLLLRTGFGVVREAAPERYRNASPGFAAAAAQYVVDHLPTVRAIGIDSLSLASPSHLQDGIRAHQILMCQSQRPVLVIEDMNLQHDLAGLRIVYALPLLCERLDSAPCTVLAELDR
jgi:arylformamidase